MPGSLIVPAGGGSLAYAGLIGDNLTLYVEVGAALCAPRNTSAPVKPGGSLNGSNQPYINSDGSVNSLTGTNTYGLLYNPVSQYTNPLPTAVQNMIEFISLGGRNAVEGWTMQFATSGANTGWFPYSTTGGSGGLYWTHSISSATWDASTDQLQLVTLSTFDAGALQVQHTFTFNGTGAKNIVTVQVQITNQPSSSLNINALTYCRALDPNQGVAPPGNTSDLNTNQSLGVSLYPQYFLVNSADQLNLSRQLGIGVHQLDANIASALLYAVNGAQTETALLTFPVRSSQGNPSYVELNADGSATYYNAGTGLTATCSNVWEWLQGNTSGYPFLQGSTPVTPAFTIFSDTDLVLMSGLLGSAGSLPAGASTTFTWYYVLGTPPPTPPPPTPSTQSCVDITIVDDGMGYDPIAQVRGSQYGGIDVGRVPYSCEPNICIKRLLTVNPINGKPFVVAARGDRYISYFQVDRPCYTAAFRYRTRSAATFGTKGQRSNYVRVRRVYVFGEGTVIDGVISMTSDYGYVENYNALYSFLVPTQQGVLLYQEFSNEMFGYEFDLDMVLTGTDIVIRDVKIEGIVT